MRKWASLWMAAACCAGASGVEPVDGERFPDADAVLADVVERVRYSPDGTYEQTEESWTKILTEKGRRSESVITLNYSKRYGEAKIVAVGAIGTNGVERAIDVSATMKESTDNSSVAINIYDPLDRTIRCLVPGLAVGETLHVKTMRKTTKPRCAGKWSDISIMEWDLPILKSTYEVTAPAALPIRRVSVRHPLGNLTTNVTRRADGSAVYAFTARRSPQAFPEPDMPPLFTQVQSVGVSTARDWQEISKWYWELCAPHLAKTNAAMVAKVGQLTLARRGTDGKGRAADGAAELEKVRAIFKFVSQEIRYMGLTMEDTSPGYAPHDADITFDNRYGVCRDKAGLLAAMLRIAGFRAYPTLIHVGVRLDPAVPQPYFNHAIVAVELPAAVRSPASGAAPYLLMDPTNENTHDLFPSYLGNCSYLVARPEGDDLRTSPVNPPEHNALDVDSSAVLARDGSLFVESEIRPKGINDNAYRGLLVKRTPEERAKTFERILKSLAPGAELVRCEILPKDLRETWEPLRVKLAARLPEMVVRGETRSELALPTLSTSLGIVNWLLAGSTSLEKRRYPLALDTTACVRERLSVDVGAAPGPLADLPPALHTTNGYDYARTFAVSNDVLTMNRTLAVSRVEFDPAAYAALREEIKRVEAAERRKPAFAVDFTRNANVRRRLDSGVTVVRADDSWVTTNELVTEVLTYRGKKDSAEIKFPYHPSWKKVEIVSAVVSNADGRVSAVSPRELNVLDADWASRAPRYPAGKILVVTLPSVEIGSVIALRVVLTATHAPAPFYARLYLDADHPVDRLVRRVEDGGGCVFAFDGKPRRLADEPAQPGGHLWRDCRILARGDWRRAAENLSPACDVRPVEPADALPELPPGDSPAARLRAIRDWMSKYVKVAGPGLYEMPLALQLTDPEVVLKERYATRLDYIRTLCALLRGAGCEADVVFAADNARRPERERRADREAHPNIRAFATALCRVRVREGGFLGFGGTTREIFLGTENEYTPVGATSYDGSDYFDPATAAFGTVRTAAAEYAANEIETCAFDIRENGAVDLTVSNLTYGADVGSFRKRLREILPEMRGRLHQSLLGGIAQAASATSELVTDTEGYPALTRFACYIPDFATCRGGTMSIELPGFDETFPNLTGTVRETPFAVAAADPKTERVTVRFPPGYGEVEHLPETFAFEGFLRQDVTVARDGEGALTVTVERTTRARDARLFEPWYAEMVKDWRRRASSRANRTISVRRTPERRAVGR